MVLLFKLYFPGRRSLRLPTSICVSLYVYFLAVGTQLCLKHADGQLSSIYLWCAFCHWQPMWGSHRDTSPYKCDIKKAIFIFYGGFTEFSQNLMYRWLATAYWKSKGLIQLLCLTWCLKIKITAIIKCYLWLETVDFFVEFCI